MINLGLTRISCLLARLPTPQTWTAIHIAGTNGKGSVAAYISSLFRHHGRTISEAELRIGKFTSPHLIDRWDCITINDKAVSQSLFLSVENQIQKLAEEVEADLASDAKVTEFELLTATAFEIFSQQKCQIAVIECGLGGRLDATNAMDEVKVAVCVITKIGLDHQGLLGHTIEEIAREKAGIAKKGVPFIFDTSNEFSVKQALRAEAEERNASEINESGDQKADFDSYLTQHQKQNLSLAVQAYQIASQTIPDIESNPVNPTELATQTLLDAKTYYPGRLQTLSVASLLPTHKSDILLDGAHNPQSATILREYIEAHFEGPITWVLGMSSGKDLSQILSVLLRPDDRVVTCPFGPVDGMPWVRCIGPVELADAAKKHVADGKQITVASDVVAALETAGPYASTVVAGSLYLVSDLLRALRDGPESVRARLR